MNEVFEVMQFGAGGGASEWEEERGGRGGGGGRGCGGGGRGARGPGRGMGMRMGQGRGPKWPRRYPITGAGPWWSYPQTYPQTYPVAYPEPYPAPYPYPEPPDAMPADPDDGMQGELPPKFRAAVARLPAPQRPQYIAIGTLDTAPNLRSIARPGLYLIVFPGRGGIKAYHGQTDNVRERLGQHRLCARMLDVDARKHLVYWAETPGGSGLEKERRRQIEKAIHRLLLPPPVGQGRGAPLLTNQKLELEQELLGEAWR